MSDKQEPSTKISELYSLVALVFVKQLGAFIKQLVLSPLAAIKARLKWYVLYFCFL